MIKATMRVAFAPLLLLAGALTVDAAGEAGIIKRADEFEFIYRVKLPEITAAARVWIPLAKTDSFQTVTVEELKIPMKWDKVQDRDYENQICVLSLDPKDSGKTIELRYRVVRQEKAAYRATDTEAARYLRPEKLVPINETFKTLAETVGEKTKETGQTVARKTKETVQGTDEKAAETTRKTHHKSKTTSSRAKAQTTEEQSTNRELNTPVPSPTPR